MHLGYSVQGSKSPYHEEVNWKYVDKLPHHGGDLKGYLHLSLQFGGTIHREANKAAHEAASLSIEWVCRQRWPSHPPPSLVLIL